MQNRLLTVAAWLIAVMLAVVLLGVIGWTLGTQPTTLDLPTPRPAVAVNPATATATAAAAGAATEPSAAPTAVDAAATPQLAQTPAPAIEANATLPQVELVTPAPTEPATEATEPATETAGTITATEPLAGASSTASPATTEPASASASITATQAVTPAAATVTGQVTTTAATAATLTASTSAATTGTVTVTTTATATAGARSTPTATAARQAAVTPTASPAAGPAATSTPGGVGAAAGVLNAGEGITTSIPITLPTEPLPPAEESGAGDAAAGEGDEGEIAGLEIVELPVPTPTPPLATGDWGAATDPNQMNALVPISNTLWIATGGGALAWTKGSNNPVLYTAADGLHGNHLTAVANCALPGFGVVFGSPSGLQIGDGRSGRWRQLNSNNGNMRDDDVTTLYCDDDNEFLIAGYRDRGIDIYDAADDEWRHMDRNSGLAANDVHAIAVVGDRDEIWVAHEEGVTRWAGSDSAFYDTGNSDLEGRAGALAVEEDGAVWIGGEGALYRVEGEEWTTYGAGGGDPFPTQPIAGMAFAPDGALWIGSTEAQICRFDVEQGACTEFFAGEEGMAAGPLTSLAVDAGGSVYYTTAGSGYAVYDGSGWRTQTVRDPALMGNQVRALAAGENGDLWAATEAGVQRLVEDQAAELLDPSPSGIDLRAVTALAAEEEEGGDDGLWAGGPGGAAFYDGSDWQPYTSADGLAGDDVRTIAVDAAGRTWFGTDRGISVWNGSSFFTIDRARGLPSDDIRALAADDDGVWIGAEGGGLYRYAGNQLQLLNRQNVGLPSDNVSALAVGPDGALWIGTDRGLARLAEGELVVDDDLGEQAITGLAVSSLGDVWAAAGDEGLFFYDGERWTQLTLADRLPSQHINALLADGDTVWLGGAEGGITRYRQPPE